MPGKRMIVLAILLGILVGIGSYTFRYAKGFSYLSDDPSACANCHIMNPQYDSWQKSSHHAVATCNDCHVPHDLVGKYLAKAENGWHHSRAFTMQDFHEPIMIKGRNREILQESCLHCHQDMVHEMLQGEATGPGSVSCVHCHASVGHGALPTGIGGPDRGELRERIGNE